MDVARREEVHHTSDSPPPNELARRSTCDRIARLARLTSGAAWSVVALEGNNVLRTRASSGLRTGLDCEGAIRKTYESSRALVTGKRASPPANGISSEHGVQTPSFFAGVPVRTNDGRTVGVLCVADPLPRAFTDRDLEVLTLLADQIADDVDEREREMIDLREIRKARAERLKHETALSQRDTLLEATASVVKILSTGVDFASATNEAFSFLGSATGCRRIAVFENRTDPESGEVQVSQRMEWAREGSSFPSGNPALQNLPARKFFGNWTRDLADGVVVDSRNRRVPESMCRLEFQDDAGPLVAIPTIIEGSWSGTLCLCASEATHAWTSPEKAILATLASTIGGLLKRRRVKQALERSEAQYRALVEQAITGIYIIRDGRFVYVNPRFGEIFGYHPDEIVGAIPMSDLVHPDDREMVSENVRRRLDGEIPEVHYSLRGLRKDGAIVHVEVHGASMEMDGRPSILGALIDVTDRVVAIEAAKVTEAKASRLAMVASRTTNGVIIMNADSRVEWINEGFTRLSGYELDEIRGRRPWEFLVAEETQISTVRRILSAMKRNESVSAEIAHRRKNGDLYWVSLDIQPTRDRNAEHDGFVWIETDLTERKHYEQGLIEAKERAEELAQLKDAFLSNMSHEIRTPLTSIIGFAEVLAEDFSSEGSDLVRMISASGQRLLETLNSVLDLANLESGVLQIKPEPVDLHESAEETVEILGALVGGKKVAACVISNEPGVQALADRRAIGRVLSNLISNALKFTEEGEVIIETGRERNTAFVSVTDTGIGIAREFLPHLFKEFRQESFGHARSHEGSGLGLAITKRLVNLMRGRIEVETEKGRGTTFTVYLPLYDPSAVGTTLPSREVDEGDPELPRILIVENQPETQILIRTILKEKHRVAVVSSAEEALEYARTDRVDLAVVDVSLDGDKTGMDLLWALRSMPGYETLPVVVCTAYALPGDREQFLAEGFNGYIEKPFRRTELLETVISALGG